MDIIFNELYAVTLNYWGRPVIKPYLAKPPARDSGFSSANLSNHFAPKIKILVFPPVLTVSCNEAEPPQQHRK